MTTGKLAACVLTMILLGLLVAPITSAKVVNSSAGTSAFPFLKINIGARQVAMGGASTGLADDVAALYYNPAGIAGLEDNMFVAGYHNYFAGIRGNYYRGFLVSQTISGSAPGCSHSGILC